jgi:hypothetical protein
LQISPRIVPGGLPAVTVLSDKLGKFEISPASHTDIAFMYLHNPPSLSGEFVIKANGYTTNEMRGIATLST